MGIETKTEAEKAAVRRRSGKLSPSERIAEDVKKGKTPQQQAARREATKAALKIDAGRKGAVAKDSTEKKAASVREAVKADAETAAHERKAKAGRRHRPTGKFLDGINPHEIIKELLTSRIHGLGGLIAALFMLIKQRWPAFRDAVGDYYRAARGHVTEYILGTPAQPQPTECALTRRAVAEPSPVAVPTPSEIKARQKDEMLKDLDFAATWKSKGLTNDAAPDALAHLARYFLREQWDYRKIELIHPDVSNFILHEAKHVHHGETHERIEEQAKAMKKEGYSDGAIGHEILAQVYGATLEGGHVVDPRHAAELRRMAGKYAPPAPAPTLPPSGDEGEGGRGVTATPAPKGKTNDEDAHDPVDEILGHSSIPTYTYGHK